MKRYALAVLTLLGLAAIAAAQPAGYLPQAKVGGLIAPDGRTQVQCDLPDDQQQQNIASAGLGCCVFRSIDHASRWQNQPATQHMPEWMVQRGVPGGGYPQKVDQLIPRIAKDRGLPTPRYIQVEGWDLEILKLACKTGRMPCVTYSYSPAGRYQGQKIAHMVNIVHCDDNWTCVLDNNFTGAAQLEWMPTTEFLKTYAYGGSGWSVILLDGPPPPVPHN